MGTANWLARTASVSTLALVGGLAFGPAACSSASQGTIPVGGDDASSGGADAPTITFPTGTDGGTGTPTSGVDTGVPVGPGGSVDGGGTHDTGTMMMTSADTGTGTGGVDATMPPVDSGATAAENEWLVPQNAARAAVGESPLVWDPIAAAVATAYANACDYLHNPNRQSQYDAMSGTNIYIGENIAAGEPTESVSEACSDWIDEKQYFTNSPSGGTCDAPDDGECGHYTQIVWNTTTGVGCAQAMCSGSTSPFGDGNSWVYSVCDYSPGGNIVGEAPY